MSLESPLEQEEDWVNVDDDWWRLSYKDVPWAYRRQFLWSLEGIKYTDHPPPPHYHESLCNDGAGVEEDVGEAGDGQHLSLHQELVGVKGVEAVMRRYEFDVGVGLPSSSTSSPTFDFLGPPKPPLFAGDLSNDDLSTLRSRWDDQVRALFGEAFQRSQLDDSYDWEFEGSVWNMDAVDGTPSRMSTPPDVVDLTDSELSADSDPPPATPNADRKSYAQVVFVDRHGQSYHDRTVVAPTPAKALNASALSFIPATTASDSPSRGSSESPYTSPTYEFHFPSLTANPPSARTTTRTLPPNLEKDDQGFYIEIPPPPSTALSNDSTRTATPKRPSASLLPAFLAEASNNRNRQMSKTRAIVDRLRSSTTSTSSDPPRRPKKAEMPPSRRSVEDAVVVQESEPDVFLDPMSNIDRWITAIENEALASGSPSCNDAWSEGSGKGRRSGVTKAKSHKRAGSSISSIAPTTPSSAASVANTFSPPSSAAGFAAPSPTGSQFAAPQQFYAFAAPYVASGYASGYPSTAPAQAAYFQMQYQMQLQAQAQWQMQMHNARVQAGMTPGYAMYQPPSVPMPPPPSTAVSSSATHSRTKSVPYTEPKRITVPITGVAGIRHV